VDCESSPDFSELDCEEPQYGHTTQSSITSLPQSRQ
jgi:hypothetical protein